MPYTTAGLISWAMASSAGVRGGAMDGPPPANIIT